MHGFGAGERRQAGLAELPLEDGPGAGVDVAGDPVAAEALGGDCYVGAAGEAIQHDAVLGAGCLDDALGKGHGLLRWVAGFFYRVLDWLDVCPQVADLDAFRFVGVPASLQLPVWPDDDLAVFVFLLEFFFADSPSAGVWVLESVPFVAKVWARSHCAPTEVGDGSVPASVLVYLRESLCDFFFAHFPVRVQLGQF